MTGEVYLSHEEIVKIVQAALAERMGGDVTIAVRFHVVSNLPDDAPKIAASVTVSTDSYWK